jgi:predicted ATP-grasp superfamily ATP-dependent carboligase
LKRSYVLHTRPELDECMLLVGWKEDGGRLGYKVIDFLCKKLDCTEFGEIELEEFFPLGGVMVEEDVAQFPECKFYFSQSKRLVILNSTPPVVDWYKFLNTVLDAVQDICVIKELYAIGNMISFTAHTAPRAVIATVNTEEMKASLAGFDVNRGIDYESPPGQRPTLSNYLMWVAKRRNIPGASLWVPVPFYLISNEDPRGCVKIVDFFNKRLELGVELTELNKEVTEQDKRINKMKQEYPETVDYINRLESNLGLSEEQSDKLIEIINKYLGN